MNECEHVIVVDVCCTIKRPTTMCLAKKTQKQNNNTNHTVLWRKTCEERFFFFFFFSASLSFARNSGRLTCVRHRSRKSSAAHLCTYVQYFPRVQTRVWLPAFGNFNVSTDVDACDCTRRLCGHRKRVCIGSNCGRKIPCRIGDSNPRQYCAWLFSRTLYQLSHCPHY